MKISEGRASEISDLGDGRVLRRFKGGGAPGREALVMEHARAHGYPVPAVLEVRDDALVLERIEGPTMLNDIGRRPWRIARHARTLAALHRRLHEIPAPAELGESALLHLDFHPDNVILSPRGPVVIDWTNAQAGDPALDLALTWIIAATSGSIPGRVFAHIYLRHVDVAAARRGLPAAAEFRVTDPNVTPAERERVRRLLR